MGKRVSNDRFERRLSSLALLVSQERLPFSRPLKRFFLPRRYSTGVQRRSDSDRALSFESTPHTLQDSVRASNYAILGMPCITRFSLFAALTKVPTSDRLLETVRYAARIGLASGVIRGNATPPNMNRSLINARAINRRIIVLGFAPTIIGEEWDSSKPERHDARRKLLRAFLFPLLRRNSTTEWERSFFTTFPNILPTTFKRF